MHTHTRKNCERFYSSYYYCYYCLCKYTYTLYTLSIYSIIYNPIAEFICIYCVNYVTINVLQESMKEKQKRRYTMQN